MTRLSHSKKAFALAIPVALVLIGLAFVGRWEHRRAIRHQVAGIEALWVAAGRKVATRQITTYRIPSSGVQCLEYAIGSNLDAVELCWDPEGRLVEAVDRRSARIPKFYSLLASPGSAPERAPVSLLRDLFHAMGISWFNT